MCLDDLPHERKPQTQSAVHACAGAVGLPESLEDMRQKRGGNADAGVAHGERDCRICGIDGKCDRAAGRSKFHGVRQQVPDHLLKPRWIARHHARGGRDLGFERDALEACGRTNGFEARARHIAQIHFLQLQLKMAGDDA